MKRNLLLALSVLAFGLQSAAVQASPYPADAEASFDLLAIESYAERHALPADSSAVWGVTKREVRAHNAFPFGGGPVDD